jgi:cell division protein FtsL
VAVNGLLSTAAVVALVNLLPYQLSQQAKLREVRSEVQQTETQINQLQAEFSDSFDPQQAKQVMQEQSGRVDPNQRQIVLVEKKGD